MSRSAMGMLALVLALAGCKGDRPPGLSLRFNTLSPAPVVLTAISFDGATPGAGMGVIAGRAEETRPGGGGGSVSLSLPKGAADHIEVHAEWSELLTGRGWQAKFDLPLADLQRDGMGNAELMPVFGPNGLLIVTSDPLPKSAGDRRMKDILQLCATRDPAGDKDWRAQPDELPGQSDILALPHPPVTDPVCPLPEDAAEGAAP